MRSTEEKGSSFGCCWPRNLSGAGRLPWRNCCSNCLHYSALKKCGSGPHDKLAGYGFSRRPRDSWSPQKAPADARLRPRIRNLSVACWTGSLCLICLINAAQKRERKKRHVRYPSFCLVARRRFIAGAASVMLVQH